MPGNLPIKAKFVSVMIRSHFLFSIWLRNKLFQAHVFSSLNYGTIMHCWHCKSEIESPCIFIRFVIRVTHESEVMKNMQSLICIKLDLVLLWSLLNFTRFFWTYMALYLLQSGIHKCATHAHKILLNTQLMSRSVTQVRWSIFVRIRSA